DDHECCVTPVRRPVAGRPMVGGVQPDQMQSGQKPRPGRPVGMEATNGTDTVRITQQAVRANNTGATDNTERTEQGYPTRMRQVAVEANEPPPPPPPAQVPEVMQEFAPAQTTGQAVSFYA
ncbi:MAG TPA: hypothetical protein PLZ55_15695, partial [bacterium]|nr:hypothetical protein [bacterium]